MVVSRADPADDGAGARNGHNLEAGLTLLREAGGGRLLLHGGTYDPPGSIVLGRGDSGIEIAACGGETPVLRGGADGAPIIAISGARRVRLSGLDLVGGPAIPVGIALSDAGCNAIVGNHFAQLRVGILLERASDNQVAANTITDVAESGIEAKDGSDRNMFRDNRISDIHGPETHGGGLFLHGANGNRIAHNLVERTDGMGIGIANWDADTLSIANVVEFNRVTDTDRTATDSGAIYLLGRSQADMQTVVAGNDIDGTGSPLQHGVGIYLDDSASGVIVTRNRVRHPGSDAVELHGGSFNTVENNFFDLGDGQASAVLFQAAPADTNPANAQTGNTVRRNLIVAVNPAPRIYVWLDGGAPLIDRNIYAGTAERSVPRAGPVLDQSPVFLTAGPAAPGAGDTWLLQRLAGDDAGFVPFDVSRAGPRSLPPADDLPPGCADRPPQ